MRPASATVRGQRDGVGRGALTLLLLAPLLACAPGLILQEALFFGPKAAALGLVVVVAVVANRRALSSARFDALDAAILGACAAAVLSTFCGQTTLRHAAPMHALEVSFAIACIVLRRRDLGRTLHEPVVVACGLVSIVAIAEACGLVIFDGIPRRPLGLLGNRNAVAGYLVLGLPLLAANRGPRGLAARMAVGFAAGTVIGMSRCRGAWLAVVVAAVVGAAMSSRGRARFDVRLVALAALGAAIGVLLPWPGLDWRDGDAMTSAAHLVDVTTGSGRGRIDEWIVGVDAWLESPVLGVGPRAWGVVAAAHAHALPDHHTARWLEEVTPTSDVLRRLVECGGLGVAAIAAVVVLVVRRASRLSDPTTRAAAFAGLSGLAVLALLDTPLLRGDMLALVACLIAFAAPSSTSPGGTRGRTQTRALLLAAVVAATPSVARAVAGILAGADDVAWRRLGDALSPSAQTRLAILERADTPLLRRDAAVALLELSPGSWGARLVAAGAYNATGDLERSRAMMRSLDAIEPHWRELDQARRDRQSRSAAAREHQR